MIGQGVYTLAEVCRYTNVPAMTLRAWFMPRSDKKGLGPIFKSDWSKDGDDFAVSFLNLIEAYVASFFKKNGVKPAYIRRAQDILKRELHTPHPFAHADLRTDLGRIFHVKIKSRSEGNFQDVISRQLMFPEFKDGLKRIKYSHSTHLAEEWRIGDGVIINPRIGFGKPVIQEAGVSTMIIKNQFFANDGDRSIVAKIFRIRENGVTHAVEFENSLN